MRTGWDFGRGWRGRRPATKELAEEPHGGHLLLAEPHPDIAEMLLLFLEDEGHAVDRAATPREAFRLLAERPFDAVLTATFGGGASFALDVPGEVCRATGATPVLLCTGWALKPAAVRAAGLAGVLRKPFDFADLRQALAAVTSAALRAGGSADSGLGGTDTAGARPIVGD